MQNQESIAWVRDRLSSNSFFGKNGQLMFKFTDYLVRYIHSIDPKFQEAGIDNAFYCTSYDLSADDHESSGAYINTNAPEQAFEIKRILHEKKRW